MRNKWIYFLITGLIILSGCGADASEKKDEPQDNKEEQIEKDKSSKALYENGALIVEDTSGWSVGKEEKNPLTVSFNHQHLKAIVTIFDTQKSFNQIKDELIAGAGDVEVIEEKEDYFSYRSKNKESIKTEVYLKQNGQQTLVLSFLANKNQFDELSDTIKEFQSAVKLKN